MSRSMLIGTSYEALPNGGVKIVVSSADRGELFTVGLPRDEAMANLVAFAEAMGLVVHKP